MMKKNKRKRKTPTRQQKPDLRRLRPLYALEKLSAAIRSDVLADGAISARFGFNQTAPIRLGPSAVVPRDDLFAAFRAVADGAVPKPLRDQDNKTVNAKISIDSDGTGIVEISEHRIRFTQASLLSTDPVHRLSELDKFLPRYPLSRRHTEYVRALVVRPEYSYDDFLSTALLFGSSPQAFAEIFGEKLRQQDEHKQITREDVLPDDVRHWTHLTADIDQSSTLAEFIGGELGEQRRVRLTENPRRGFHIIGTTFASPALVPHALLGQFNSDTVLEILEATSKNDDHFTLIGAFEVCAGWVEEDQRFIALGDKLLSRLFSDLDRLVTSCGMFAAFFVIATAHLAEHEELKRKPVYWRRLAAAAHASLLVRVCGVSGSEHERVTNWAMHIAGESYFLSVVTDLAVEPQWRPEWIATNFLVADTFGRALAVWQRLRQDAALSSWKKLIEHAYEWVVHNGIGPLTQFPAVLEGVARPQRLTLAEPESGSLPQATEAYRRLASEPSIDNLLGIAPFFEAFGFPPEVMPHVLKVLDLIRTQGAGNDERRAATVFAFLAHIAVLTKNAELTDGVAEVCLDRARAFKDSEPLFEIVTRLVECAGVGGNRTETMRIFAQRMEFLAHMLPSSELLSDLVSVIQKLKLIQPSLAPFLGKALAIARLGLPHSQAA
jgi:GNAT superfamily N-acetyltransferase